MGKKHLLPPGNEEFLDRLGLTDLDKEVYIAILDAGLVALGEIQQLTKIQDLAKILESVRDLNDIGLVKKAQGTMPRYFAALPFLRETLSVEKEFQFSLESMLQSLKQQKEKTKEERERIVATVFPKIVDALLDEYYQKILSPVISDLEELKETIESDMVDFARSIDNEADNIKEEISLMLEPVEEYTKLLNQKFELGLSNEQDQLSQYISNRKQKRIDLLKNAHSSLKDSFNDLRNTSDTIEGKLHTIIGELESILKTNNQVTQLLSNQLTDSQNNIEQINNAQKELKAELLVARQKVRNIVDNVKAQSSTDSTETEENTHSEGKDHYSDEIDNIFDNLTDKINNIEMDPNPVADAISNAQSSTQNLQQQLENQLELVRENKSEISTGFDKNIQELSDQMSSTLNEINENDDESLSEFNKHITKQLNSLKEALLEHGESVRTKLNDHINSVKQDIQSTMNHWDDKMIEFYKQPKSVITQFLENWVDDIEPIIDSFKQQSDEALSEITEPILKLEEETFSTLQERIGFVKAMVEGRANDLQAILNYSKNFDYTKSSNTWAITGLPAIYASLTDLLLRTKVNVTVVTPHLDLELVELARGMKSSIRITFVTDIDKDRDATLIKKMKDTGRIKLRNYEKRDLYACIRDSEEIIFGYIKEGEETIGIRSSTPSIVELLEDRLNETVIRNSKQI